VVGDCQRASYIPAVQAGKAVNKRNVCPYHGVAVAAFRVAVLHLMSQEIDVVNRRQTG
jgi:hypothetical protein